MGFTGICARSLKIMPDFVMLVSSCDKYAACWPPYLHGLNKYWPDHPPVFFITNQLESPDGHTIKTGPDKGWAANLRFALSQIDAEIVLYSQEDYWLQSDVDHAQIEEYINLIRDDQADYIRLYPAPPPDLPSPLHDKLGVIQQGSRYRASLQMSLWRKSTLLAMLDENESPWKFEVNGSRRSDCYSDRFLCVTKRRFGIEYVFTAVVNGYWSKLAHEYAEREGITIDFAALPRKSPMKQVQDQVRSAGYRVKKKLMGRS
jgi:hypothetical protein